ncbi:hypothetical protein AMELA_G00264570 [Ameiurus melas]|uniref:PSI domain-containing protein n=1 Tax=Ameiurus melas TaxID=219545 RepID=A0A7J5ZRL9_AMEME|nr:hypothetical protein AMELA_G00264570 [Ameiurus melas]
MKVQMKNVQQVSAAITSTWSRISKERFQYLVDSMPRRILGDTPSTQVFVHVNGSGSQYDSVMVDPQRSINADLLLDSTLRNVYILTERKVTRLPVSQCERHSDCHSCLSVQDPYCGWCSLEGRCTRKLECARRSQPHHWLWSYGRDRQCVYIYNMTPELRQSEQNIL